MCGCLNSTALRGEDTGEIPHYLMTVPSGEDSKSFAFFEKALNEMLSRRLNRQWVCIAIGGGVTGDFAGFAASVYMRGIPVVQVATTLLAQVDSSIGGKTAINSAYGKNLIGTFTQPLFVLSDADFLATLDDSQMKSAMAEVIKYGIIMNRPLFEYIEAGPPYDYEKIAVMCSADKASVVSRDEREGGLRRILNFGHTLGHAIEKSTDFTILHGEAVAAGMLFSLWLSRERGLLSPEDYERMKNLIMAQAIIPSDLKLPSAEDAGAAMSLDKKGEGAGVHFVLTHSIGGVTVEKLTDIEVLEAYRGFTHGYERGL